MTLVMSYVVLLAAAIGACGALMEGVLERKHAPRRWIWMLSLGFTLAITALVMVWPVSASDPGVALVTEGSTLVLSEPTATALEVAPRVDSVDVMAVTDTMLPFVWLFSSVVLLLIIAFGQRRLRRERALAQPARLAGHLALVSETIGPAVAGLRSPVVFVPRWVFALDEPSQRLLMAHEMEHVRKRDTAVLFAGALSAALVPWNPVVWWMLRRLRLAVEQDCDARVLASSPGVRRYADLLLLAASRPGLKTRLLAAHLGEHSSDLVRRIETMTRNGRISWRRLLSVLAIAGVLVAAACEAPRPAPVAPISVGKEATSHRSEAEIMELERRRAEEIKAEGNQGDRERFSVTVFASDGKQLARYAGEIPVAHLPKDGVQSIKADEYRCGTSDCLSVRITLKPGHALNLSEIDADKLPYKRSENGARLRELAVPEVRLNKGGTETLINNARLKVDTLRGVELSGEAREVRVNSLRDVNEFRTYDEASVPGQKDKIVLYHLHDPKAIGPEPPNVVVYRSDGSEVARFPSPSHGMSEIALFGVESIKEEKTGDCAPLACPLNRITLKPGFRLVNYTEWKGRGK